MKLAIIIILLFPVIGYSIFVDCIMNFINYYEIRAVTHFSCIEKESFNLLKRVTQLNINARVLKVDPKYVSHVGPANRNLFILNLECDNSLKLLQKSNELNYFTFPFKWILFYRTSLEEMDKYFQKFDIPVDSDVTICNILGNGTIMVKKIFKYRSGHPLQIENAGYWTKNGGYNDLGMEKVLARRRNDLKGTVLTTCIVVTNNDTLNHLTDKRDKHIDSITKVNYVIIQHLNNIVNATQNITVESTWGYKMNNSQYSGMLGYLTRNEADIGGTALFFTIDRIDIIEYAAMVTPTKSKFVFRAPKLSYVSNVFTLPFDRQVWISTAGLVVLIGLFIHFILKWELYKNKANLENDSANSNQKIDRFEVALMSFGAVCQQASPIIPTSIPGRITTIFLFVSLMFLYTSYAANIVALLQSSSSSIQTLEDLLKSRLKTGVFDTVYNRHYFPRQKDPIRRAIYEQKIAPFGQKDNFMPLDEGVRKIRDGLFAFHMETGVGYKVVGEIFKEHEKCGLQEIPFFDFTDPHIAIQKNSSYRKLLKIGKIWESGIQPREVNLIYTKKPICTSRSSGFITVGMVDCYSAIVVLVVGTIASILIWSLEIIIFNRSKLKQQLYNFINNHQISLSFSTQRQ